MEAPSLNAEAAVSATTRAAFPWRAAAMDVGSNAIRFTFAEFNDVHHFAELESQRLAIRLGHDAFTTGLLSQVTLDATVAAAAAFRQRLDDLGIRQYRAVATSAVRESRNGGELVELIRRESGIHLETITGSEEARLVWLAVQQRLPVTDGRWILADLGGGSIEISVIGREGILASDSYPFGTVRLLEDLPAESEQPERFRALLRSYVARLSLPAGADSPLEGIIITGGNADALGDLAAPPAQPGTVSDITRSDLRRILQKLAALDARQRMEVFGLREDRADVIVPAAIIFDRICELAGSDRILIPRVGVKDGLLQDMVLDHAEHRQHESELDRVMRAGAIAVGRRYRFDENHARHVADLSLSLFDQLRGQHELGESSRRRLEAGALLHDIGQCVSYRRHHKHSWYLVTHSELPGLSTKDSRLVALLTRYHRRSEPREYHEGYSDLNDGDRLEVRKLSAILRIADALDHEHRKRVREVRLHLKGRGLQIQLLPGGDTVLEQWALRKKSPLFEKVYGLELQVV